MAVSSPQPALTPSASTELQKQSSVSSIKEALLAGTPTAGLSSLSTAHSPSVNDSQLSQPKQSLSQHGGYPFNSPHLPDLRENLGQGSPLTPQPSLPKTPDPSTPRGGPVSSPAIPPAMFIDSQDSDGDNSQPSRSTLGLQDRRNFAKSPLTPYAQNDGNVTTGVRDKKEMNLLDAHPVHHNSLKSPSSSCMTSSPCDLPRENSEGSMAMMASPGGSPLSPRRAGKGRSPVMMSPVDRNHSVSNLSPSPSPPLSQCCQLNLDYGFSLLSDFQHPLCHCVCVCTCTCACIYMSWLHLSVFISVPGEPVQFIWWAGKEGVPWCTFQPSRKRRCVHK